MDVVVVVAPALKGCVWGGWLVGVGSGGVGGGLWWCSDLCVACWGYWGLEPCGWWSWHDPGSPPQCPVGYEAETDSYRSTPVITSCWLCVWNTQQQVNPCHNILLIMCLKHTATGQPLSQHPVMWLKQTATGQPLSQCPVMWLKQQQVNLCHNVQLVIFCVCDVCGTSFYHVRSQHCLMHSSSLVNSKQTGLHGKQQTSRAAQ